MFPLTSIWGFIAYLFIAIRRVYSLIVMIEPNVSDPTQSSSKPLRQPVSLPTETLDLIFLFHIASLVADLQCETVRDYRIRQKCFMQELCRVARCSKLFNQVMRKSLRRVWSSVGCCPSSLVAQSSSDKPLALGVRIITSEKGYFPLDFSLAAYVNLEIASINYHAGVQWNGSEQRFLRFRCINAYPQSLRQLELLRLHAPEEDAIRLISDCCPGLTELRLVRCTMFNDPTCWYWRTHKMDSDHDYMQSDNPAEVIAYANRMAHLLRGLQQLEAIHIGHYLIGIGAVYAHRTDRAHKQHHPITDNMSYIDGITVVSPVHLTAMATQDDGPPIDGGAIRLADRELWAQPCPQCERDFRRPIERAERLAARIFAAHFDSLVNVSFAGFLSDRRIRPSSWQVGRQRCGEDLYVWANNPHSQPRILQQVVRVNNGWRPLQFVQ